MKRIVIVAALLLAAGIAEAQQLPPGKWWRRPEVVRELTLTTDQQEKLDDVFRVAADDLIDAKAAVDKLQLALRGEIDRTQLRRNEIERLGTVLHEARGKLFSRELMMLVEMRSVLNDAQWNRLRQHLDRMQQRGEGNNRMPGGQGRPGMGGGGGRRPGVGPGRRP